MSAPDLQCPFCGFVLYNATETERLIKAAQAALTEMRREFARGDLPDIDELEDALK